MRILEKAKTLVENLFGTSQRHSIPRHIWTRIFTDRSGRISGEFSELGATCPRTYRWTGRSKIAKANIDSGADYLLSVKENQGHLSWFFEYDPKNQFKDASYDHAKAVNKGHGCIEIRGKS